MTRKESEAKTFNILHFVADNAGLSIFEAIEKAYNMGVSEQQPKRGKWIGEESLDGSIRYMRDNCKEFECVDYYDFCPNCGADMKEEQDEK